MIYPIVPYGDPVLRKVAKPIKLGSIDLIKLSEDMFETMYAASGVGLAAPQIGMDIRLFVVDGRPMNEDEDEEEKDPSLVNFKKVFVNATILDETGEEWGFEEGCLSIPGVRGEVFRPEYVKIHYWDEHWVEQVDDCFGEDFSVDEGRDVEVFELVLGFVFVVDVVDVADDGGVFVDLLFGVDEFLEVDVELLDCCHVGVPCLLAFLVCGAAAPHRKF